MLPLFLALMLAGPQEHADTVKAGVEYQTIDNFGASDCWSFQKIGGWTVENREKIADLLFSRERGIGLSCWRFNIGGGVNPQIRHPWRSPETFETGPGEYDWKRQANERKFLRAAKQRGVPQFLAFVNSPPGRMTRNGQMFTTKGMGSTNLKEGYEGQFARYLGDILQHFRDNRDLAERIEFDYVSPVNEPQWQWDGHSQEGSRYSNADIKRVTLALQSELKSRGLKTRISLVESGSLPDMWRPHEQMTRDYGTQYGNYLAELCGDKEIAPLLGGVIGYHSYWSDRPEGQLLEHRQRLAEEMKKYPQWKLWQTEYCILDGPEGRGGRKRDLGMDTALNVARVIHLDLTVVGASAWQWWTAFSPEDYKDGLIYTDWKKPGDPETVYASRTLWALGHYSRFVRPGMKRVDLATDAHNIRGLLGSAYKDEKARTIVAVYVNMSEAEQLLTLDFDTKWKLRSVQPYVTSGKDGDELKQYPALKDVRGYRIPARSIVTLVAQFR